MALFTSLAGDTLLSCTPGGQIQLVSPGVLSRQLYLRATYDRYKALQDENSVGLVIDWIAAPVGVEESEVADFYGEAGCEMSNRARRTDSPPGFSCQKDRSQEIPGAVTRRTKSRKLDGDGSGYRGHVGAAVITPKENGTRMKIPQYMGPETISNVYSAELRGLQLATTWNRVLGVDRARKEGEVHVFIDSQAALKAMNAGEQGDEARCSFSIVPLLFFEYASLSEY
ncbi:hypothetical protein BO87DRAFT_420492 [Aspergillus neoniger CBS 115656]|uniref:RNase H type-1 domain-containing protein n=1 Tax=Aspergillus neoniger (strain CBS 115656) TaxID=1448310 RepID=A0A318YS78_ASPNB|nr:hypothetical protein BO87DRAFT_420492 [Aspergillus neoniger CBS 115656]PYH28272.1 hypothetical protein BO87DRAFT_420492 [Aspergillus neoniger CBS 115656]